MKKYWKNDKGNKLKKRPGEGKNIQCIKYVIDHLEIRYKKALYTTF